MVCSVQVWMYRCASECTVPTFVHLCTQVCTRVPLLASKFVWMDLCLYTLAKMKRLYTHPLQTIFPLISLSKAG